MTSRHFSLLPLAIFGLAGCHFSINETIAQTPLSQLPRHRRLAEMKAAAQAVAAEPVPQLSDISTTIGLTFDAPPENSEEGAYLAYLQSTPPKHSLLVLEPQFANNDSFYAGCSRWMKLYGAGSTAFDSGSTWGMADDVRRDRNWNSLALAPDKAEQMASALNASCVAVGSVKNGALTYQVLDVTATPRVVGTFTLPGTKAQIIAGLPKLTSQISAAAGAPNFALPATVGLKDVDLAFLGSLPFHDRIKTPFSDKDRAHLALLADQPLAAMFAARASCNAKTLKRSVEVLLAMAPSNIAAGAELTNYEGENTPRITAALHALDTKYPRHFCVALGNALLRGSQEDYPGQVHYDEIAVRSAPDSAFAWYELSEALSTEAAQTRQSKYYSQMTASEKSTVAKLYPQALAAAWKATQLEPRDSSYWTSLSDAATFDGYSNWGETALIQSLKLNPSDDYALSWAMQIYQPKWGGTAAGFAKMARFAVENARGNGLSAKGLCEGLEKTGQPALKSPFLQILLRNETNNIEALVKYSYSLRIEMGDVKKAYPLAKRAVQLAPDSVMALEELGDIEQHDRGEYVQAIAHLGHAAELEPQNGTWWVNLALPYAKSGQIAKAKAVALKGRALGYTGPHPAWGLVGLGPDGSPLKPMPTTSGALPPSSR